MHLGIFILKWITSFLMGAIPFAVVSMWGTGIDITKVGSRNPGFNNVLRVSSKWRAAITLVGDVSKGWIALLLLSSPSDPIWGLWSMGLAAVIGHCWNPFLGFKGGKGVATMAGILLFLEFQITLGCLLLYPLLRLVGRRLGWPQEGAISSLITMLVISALILGLRGLQPGLFALVALAMVILRHASNLREILSAH